MVVRVIRAIRVIKGISATSDIKVIRVTIRVSRINKFIAVIKFITLNVVTWSSLTFACAGFAGDGLG
jgi:hypothetical protein